jgi:hypothetical protein
MSTPPLNDSKDNQDCTVPEPASLTFWQVLGSVIAAAFGVQSSKNRERDFTQGKASHFILMGVGFTAVFVILMVLLVQFVLSVV